MKFNTPKGTRDLIGQDFYEMQFVASKILTTLESYAYQQVRTPNFEPLDLLMKDAGEEMLDQIYRFKDKGGREYGLKSDITPALTRIVTNIGASAMRPIKLCTYDRVYRYERPQSGRYREITQINGEMFGSKSSESDAESISTLINCYRKLGLYDFKIIIGYRPILVKFLKNIGVKDKNLLSVIRIIDKRKKISKRELDKGLAGYGLAQKKVLLEQYMDLNGDPDETILKAIKFFQEDKKIIMYLNNLSEIIRELKLSSDYDKCLIDFGLARGSAYYTGIIFEAISDYVNELGSFGAGGRYDNLVKMYGGKDIPAVGFSIGLDRLILTLKNKDLIQNIVAVPKIDYYLISEKDGKLKLLTYQIAKSLRQKGVNVEMDLMNKNVSEQFVIAKKKSNYGILIKMNLAEQGKVKKIDFTSESESTITIDELLL